MTDFSVSRRNMLAATPLAAGAGLAGMAGLASAPAFGMSAAQADELIEDPSVRAKVRARVIGSCEEETSMKFYRLNIYGYVEGRNLVPFFTMNHLSVADWKPVGNDIYESRTWECGYYCKFDTDEALDVWENPFTGEKLDVFNFLGGPFMVNVGADGVITEGADLEPQVLRMEQLGNLVMVPTIASMNIPSMVDPKKYPQSYAGPRSLWESQATFAAESKDAFNDDLSKAPAFCHFQNMASWHPWLRMGVIKGSTYGNARGVKIKDESEIPLQIRKDLEKYTPEIFDRENWQSPKLEILEYLATQTPAE